MERKKVGNEGEEAVSGYLEARGHTILERNFRAGHLELDVITLAQDGVHFVEVKTRRPPMQLDPRDCVTIPKQKRLVRAAMAYLNRTTNPFVVNAESHFDIAAVVIDGGKMDIRYYADAFIPIYY